MVIAALVSANVSSIQCDSYDTFHEAKEKIFQGMYGGAHFIDDSKELTPEGKQLLQALDQTLQELRAELAQLKGNGDTAARPKSEKKSSKKK